MTRYESLQKSIEASRKVFRFYLISAVVFVVAGAIFGLCALETNRREFTGAMVASGFGALLFAGLAKIERNVTIDLYFQRNRIPVLFSLTMFEVTAFVTPKVFEEGRRKRPNANTIACDEYLIYTDRTDVPRTGPLQDIRNKIANGDVIVKTQLYLFVPFVSEGLASMEWQLKNCRVVPSGEVEKYLAGK